MPDSEENPAGSSAQKSAFRPVDSDQFQIGTPTRLTPFVGDADFDYHTESIIDDCLSSPGPKNA
jgi:hypothetical protein